LLGVALARDRGRYQHCRGAVKIHLIEVMRKMNAQSLPEFGRMADRLKLVFAKLKTF
jgi:FixJ family two-component response regulator